MTHNLRIFFPLLVASFISLPFETVAQTAGATKIHLTWVDSFDRIEPDPMNGIVLAKSMTLTLNDNKQTTEQFHVSAGGQRHWGWKTGSTLGQGWKVMGPNILSRTDNLPNSVISWKVVVSGQTCTFTISHTLKAGAKVYITPMLSRPGRAGRYSRLEATQPRCSIE
ncbi:MAG: hypothetical protein HY242_16850 [Afipia sp.]|nr:hypothetical protein [Afipia sp.]